MEIKREIGEFKRHSSRPWTGVEIKERNLGDKYLFFFGDKNDWTVDELLDILDWATKENVQL